GTLIAVAAVNVLRDGMVLGYAIPIDVARLSADQLLATGKVSRVWLGIEGEDLGRIRSEELDVAGGVVLKRIKPDSPASRADLSPGMVIVDVDGEPVPTMAALVLALRRHQAGSTVTLTIWHAQKTSEVSITLTERPTNN
ncbi:MAG: S1C family serine protease, partial [Acidimicrobiales bacterium]